MEKFDKITELSILYEISSMPVRLGDLDKLAEILVEKAARLLGNDLAVLYLYNHQTEAFTPYISFGVQLSFLINIPLTLMTPALKTAFDKGQLLVWSPEQKNNIPCLLGKPYQVRCALYTPLKTEDEMIGFLYVARFEEESFSQSEQFLMSVLGSRFTIGYENLMMYRKLENALAELKQERNRLRVLNKKLTSKNFAIKKKNNQLRVQSRTDELTKLFNRSAIYEFLIHEKQKMLKESTPDNPNPNFDQIPSIANEQIPTNHFYCITFAMIDVDNFKSVNDKHGHLAGDSVLKVIGAILLNEGLLRKSDIAGRFGGEEFLIIFPDTGVLDTLYPIKRFCSILKEKNFNGKDNQVFNVTVSVGLADCLLPAKHIEAIIQQADDAMYYAKEHGRDQIVVYQKNEFHQIRTDDVAI
jgi:diguanylate cyclase (GGDEF)-like protein